MMRFAALDHGQRFLLVEAERRCAVLGADGAVGGIVAGAVEEHADAQGDGLTLQLLRLVAQLFLFFLPQWGEVAGLFLPGTGHGDSRPLGQCEAGQHGMRGGGDIQRFGRHEGVRRV